MIHAAFSEKPTISVGSTETPLGKVKKPNKNPWTNALYLFEALLPPIKCYCSQGYWSFKDSTCRKILFLFPVVSEYLVNTPDLLVGITYSTLFLQLISRACQLQTSHSLPSHWLVQWTLNLQLLFIHIYNPTKILCQQQISSLSTHLTAKKPQTKTTKFLQDPKSTQKHSIASQNTMQSA